MSNVKKQPQVRPKVESGPVPVLTFTAQRRGKPPRHFADITPDEYREVADELGIEAFRMNQLARHYYANQEADPGQMTDLPAAERDTIGEKLFPPLLNLVHARKADGGQTIKSLWKLYDGVMVESVLMKYPERATLCVSSQAGCGMACPFCATGQQGFTRNLSVAEIIEQVRAAMIACERGDLGEKVRLTNIVFMGMGEPMVNFKAVLESLHRICDPAPTGLGISARGVTVSTVGLVPGINKLRDLGLPVTLAVSLHAPDDELRDELIPINSRFKVTELLDAAHDYFTVTGRRVSIEYALIKDMNDHEWRAQKLADELNKRGRGWAHVNPIPLNPTPGSIWTSSTKKAQNLFVQTLRDAGIRTTIRDTRGSDIDGACGQLAAEIVANQGVK